MTRLIDSSLWIDLFRARSPRELKEFVLTYVEDLAAYLAEPIIFEVLRFALPHEIGLIREVFSGVPVLPTPPDLWHRGVELGQSCRRRGVNAGSLDLLIAAIAIYHEAEFVTFDAGFEGICNVSPLRLMRLERPK